MKYIIYELYDRDKYLGEYTSSEIARLLKCRTSMVAVYAANGYWYKGRWLIRKTNKIRICGWEEGWNAARKRILDAEGRGGGS